MTSEKCDLLIRNVMMEDYDITVDLSIKNGKISSIGSNLDVFALKEFDGTGCIVSPPFVDPHTHLDKAFLNPSPNFSGTLEEAISIMQQDKEMVIRSDINNRINKALTLSLKNGTLFIRTHVDIDKKTGTKSIEFLQTIKKKWKNIIDLQIVAFPQDGLVNEPILQKYMREAMKIGADVVGGIPAIEDSLSESQEHIDTVFQIADEFDKDIDMHIDESDDPSSRTLEMLADATLQSGWHGRITAAHCCALSAYPDSYAKQVIEKVAEADISIITNPTTNLVLQGRKDNQPIRRGITRVKELIAAGVNVSCGSDNLQDVFYPFGKCDMLEVAFVTSLTAHMTGVGEISYILDMPRKNAAEIFGINSYDLVEGNNANMILIPAESKTDLLAYKPPRNAIIRNGVIVGEVNELQKLDFTPSQEYFSNS